jgi:transposase
MTDDEWGVLTKILRRSGRGRPPTDARRTWNGIFWVACSRSPWREMPDDFGRPGTALRALHRAASTQRLHRLLLLVARLRGLQGGPLEAIEWFIVRAFRRAFRIAPNAIGFARRLGLASALPAEPAFLPDRDLSEKLTAFLRDLAVRKARLPLGTLQTIQGMMHRAVGKPWLWKATG